MMRNSLIIFLIGVLLCACTDKQPLSAQENTIQPSRTIPPTASFTAPSPTFKITQTPTITATPWPTKIPPPTATYTATPRPTATPVPTPITFVRDNHHIPQPAVAVSGENADQMIEIARLGYGAVQNIQHSADQAYTFIQTPLGVHAYYAGTFDQAWMFEVDNTITAMAVSASGWVALGSADGEVFLLSNTDGNLIEHAYLHPIPISSMEFSAEGSLLAVGGERSGVTIWKVTAERGFKLLHEILYADQVDSLGFLADDSLLIIDHYWVVETTDGTLLRRLPDDSFTSPQLDLYFADQEVRRISTDEIVLEALEVAGYNNMDFYNAAFSPNGKYFALAVEGSYYKIWQIDDGALVMTVNLDGGYGGNWRPVLMSGPTPIYEADFSQDGKYLVLEGRDDLSGGDSRMIIINLETRMIHTYFAVHGGWTTFAPDGRTFYYTQSDSLELREIPSGNRTEAIFWGWYGANVFFSPGTSRLTFGGTIWNLQTGSISHMPERETIIGFSGNGNYIYSMRNTWWLVTRRTSSLQLHHQVFLQSPRGHPELELYPDLFYTWDEFSHWNLPADGAITAVSRWFQPVSLVYDPDTGQLIKIIESFSDLPHFSPGGDLIGYDFSSNIQVYSNLLQGDYAPTHSFESGTVFDVYFTQDDQIYSLSENAVKLFTFPSGELIATYPIEWKSNFYDHSIFVITDDNRVAFIATNKNILIWDLENESPIGEYTTRYGSFISLALSSDNRYLAAGTDQGIVHLFGVEP